MDRCYLALFLLLSWISLSRSLQLVNISERVKSRVMGETFFGPKELLDSSIADMEVFKRIFTLPKESQTSQYLSGNATTILDKLSNVSPDVDTLVINFTLAELDWEDFFLQGLKSHITELWVFTFGSNDYMSSSIDLNMARLRCKVIHIINNLHKSLALASPKGLSEAVQVLHLYNVYYIGRTIPVNHLLISNIMPSNVVVLAITYPYAMNASMANIQNQDITYPLQYLSLTGDIVSLPRNLATDYPDLKGLFISINFRLELDYYLFYANTILFHPNLQLFALRFSESKWLENIITEQLYWKLNTLRDVFGSRDLDKSDFFVNQRTQCRFIKSWLGQRYKCNGMHFSLDYDHRELPISISPRLQEFYCSGLSYTALSPLMFYCMLGKLLSRGVSEFILNPSSSSLVKLDYSQMAIDFSMFDNPWFGYTYETDLVDFEVTRLENMEILCMNNVDIERKDRLYGIFNKTARHKLKSVELRDNHLPSPVGLQLCVNQQNLQSVDLSFNEINEIPMYFLQGCIHLKYLNLSNNKIGTKEIPMYFLQDCEMLKYLNLSHNQIRILPIAVHKDIERLEIKVDLSFNPLNCDCHPHAIATLRHLHANSHKYEAFNEYVCFGHGRNFLASGIDLDVHFGPCEQWTIQEIIGVGIASSGGSFLVAFLIWLSIKYRYRLVKFLCSTRRKLLCKSDKHQNFPFDLYLVYDRDDRCFVHNIFIKAMEDISGFKCCVPFRDFPGEGIQSEFIYRYMDASRYVVVMLSRTSVNKYWTSFETERAQDLERRKGKTIFYVKLDNLGPDVTHEVKKVLDSGNFTEWPKDFRNDNKGVQFFHKLIGEIHSEELCDVCCTCTTPSSRLMPLDDQSVEMHLVQS